MKRRQIDWDNLVPLGLGGRLTAKWILAGLVFAVCFAWILFEYHLSSQHGQLYWYHINRRELNPDAVMGPFYMTIRGVFNGFGIVILCMLPLSAAHYFYHYQDTRSIYLMRRLPNRWELWRRCLALPLLCVVVCAVLAAAHLLIFYAIYYVSTPKQCLQPGQWRMLWENLFN